VAVVRWQKLLMPFLLNLFSQTKGLRTAVTGRLLLKLREKFIEVDFGTAVPRLDGNAFSWTGIYSVIAPKLVLTLMLL